MAWTTPRDWTGIADDIVTAGMLNVDLRDNLTVLSSHSHTGSAGQGASSMSGVTLAALTTLTFADQSANPDAAGELQRNGNDLLFYGASAVNLTAADQAAGTASLRTLGTTSVKAAAGNHTHEPTAPNVVEVNTQFGADTDDESVVCTTTFTPQAAMLSVALVGTLFQLDGSGNTYTARLKHGLTIVDSVEGITPDDNGLHLMQGLQTAAAESSTVYTVTIQRTAGSAAWANTAATLVAREVARTT